MFKRIVLAVDGSESSEVAASFVAAMALRDSSAVRVVFINEFLVGGRGFARKTPKEAQAMVDGVVRSLVIQGVPAHGEVRVAYAFDMASRIVDVAEDWAAEVIVFGSRRRRTTGLFGRLTGLGMREKVTALTALPTITAPAPLRVSRRQRVDENIFALPLSDGAEAKAR